VNIVRGITLELKRQVINKLLKNKITPTKASVELGCSRQTIYNYLNKIVNGGLEALRDGRHSNNCKLTPRQLSEVVKQKKQGSWRSARKVLEITNIQSISGRRVQQIWVERGLNQLLGLWPKSLMISGRQIFKGGCCSPT
jgi:transposase